MFPAIISMLTSFLPSVFERILPGDSDAVKQARMNFELQKAGIDKSIVDKLGDVDIQQAAANTASAASGSFFASGWRNMLGWALVLEFIIRFPLTTLLQFINGFHAGIFIVPVYASGELAMQLLSGLLGLSLVYSRYKEKQNIINSVAGTIMAAIPDKLVEAGATGKIVDGKQVMRDNNGVEYVYKD